MSLFSSLCICIAFILNWFAAAQCNFLSLSLTYGNSTQPDTLDLHFGIWSYQTWTKVSSINGPVIFEGCHHYPEFVEVDPLWKAARAFSVMALVFCVGMMLVTLYSMCDKVTEKELRVSPVTGLGYTVCSLFSGLSLLLLGSDLCKDNTLSDEIMNSFPNNDMNISSCHIATAGKCSISATILAFLAGAASLHAYFMGVSNDKNEKGNSRNGTVEPLLLGYDDFNSASSKWLHGTGN